MQLLCGLILFLIFVVTLTLLLVGWFTGDVIDEYTDYLIAVNALVLAFAFFDVED